MGERGWGEERTDRQGIQRKAEIPGLNRRKRSIKRKKTTR